MEGFDTVNDELARRTRRVDNGDTENAFGYNLRSEVASATMGGNDYTYRYDPIGNREEATRAEVAQAETTLYLCNPLNRMPTSAALCGHLRILPLKLVGHGSASIATRRLEARAKDDPHLRTSMRQVTDVLGVGT